MVNKKTHLFFNKGEHFPISHLALHLKVKVKSRYIKDRQAM